MINNSCNQENDVYVDRREKLAADQAVTDLSEEELKVLLEELTDHNLPDSEKCPLVQRLNAENAAKDEPDLVISRLCKSSTAANTSASNSCRNNRKSRYIQRSGSKDAEFAREKNGSNVKAVHSSQSLQDLMSSANSESDSQAMRAIGANRSGKRLNKASRANSFTMPSGSQHFCNNNNVSKDNFEVSSSELRTNSQPTHSSKGIRNKNVKSRPTPHVSNTSVNENSVKSDDELTVSDATISSRSVNECYATVHTDNHNMDSLCDNNCTLVCNSSVPVVEPQVCEIEMKDFRKKAKIIEYTSNPDNNQYFNCVDQNIEFGLKQIEPIKTSVAERVVNHNCDSDPKDYTLMSDDNRLMQFQGAEALRAYDQTNCSNPYQESDLANYQHNQQLSNRETQLRNANNSKKKKKTDPIKLSEEIEGHIGFKDVEYLEAFVNSNDSTKNSSDVNSKPLLITNPNVKESVKKKDKTIQMLANNVSNKRKSGSNASSSATSAQKNSVSPNIPLSTSSSSFSSDEANSVSKHSDFAQRTDSLTNETTSPHNSSSVYKNKIHLSRENSDNLEDEKLHQSFNSSFTSLITSNMSADLLYTQSDSEMADREKGFVTPKSKHLKRRKGLMRRTENQRNKNSSSVQSSVSTTPSSSTVSGTVGHYTSGQFERFGGMRGYESEREYTEDFRRKQNNSSYNRRKSLSSVPHSEQNSAYNSDGELSSHSMPIRNDSLNTEKSNSDSRTTPSSISSTPKASYADIAKHLNFGLSLAKRSSVDAIYVTNPTVGSLSVQYQDFPHLDLSLTPVADVSTPSSPNNSKMIEALVSPQQKTSSEKRDSNSDSYSAPNSMTNTPLPQTVAQNECLFSETVKNASTDSNPDVISDETDVSTVPAVIMCDYSESVPFTDIGSVTFGFFDDLSTSSEQNQNKNETQNNESSELKLKSAIKSMKTSPEAKSHVNTNGPKLSAVQLKYIDVDKKSFNYEHIISFIKKAWDNAKRDHQCYESYESSPKVN